MKEHLNLLICVLALASAPKLLADDTLYTETGDTPSWKSLIDSGKVVIGEPPAEGSSFKGSVIDVNNELLEPRLGGIKSTVQPERIHTHVSSRISPKMYLDWSRWYQEDGITQVFRLFKGEQSVRSKDNVKAGRIEAVKGYKIKKPGDWVKWEGTYTPIKPIGAAIFQLLTNKNPDTDKGGLWAFHLNMNANGDIRMKHRRVKKGEPREVMIAEGAIGKSVRVKVRYDGENYEVYRKIHGTDSDFVLVAKGSYPPTYGAKGAFRWGMYQGSKPGSSISDDAILFVTGVQVR